MLLVDTHDLTIDGKNRLSIPASVRAGVDPETEGTMYYLVPGTPITTLHLYPDVYFRRLSAEQRASLAPSAERAVFEQVYYSMVTLLEPDGQGRVVLPKRHLDRVGIGRNVSLIGAVDHLEIWNRSEREIHARQLGPRHADLYQAAVDKTRELQVAGIFVPPARS